MSYYVFDLDGTLRDITHRRPLVADGANQWDKFFLSCDKDEPVWPVIQVFADLVNAGHRVEIWSGASAISYDMTIEWMKLHILPLLDYASEGGIGGDVRHDMNKFLVNMRPQGNYIPDDILKRQWLDAEDVQPDMIFDDRQKVVDMWRRNGVVCAQIAPGDFDKPKATAPRKPKLTMLIGPSGAGKTLWYQLNGARGGTRVSTDEIRQAQYPSETEWCDRQAYTHSGIRSTHLTATNIAKAHIAGGLDVIYDATNIKRADRVGILKSIGAEDGNVDVEYVIIDRPLIDKIDSFHKGPKLSEPGRTSEAIITKHHNTFNASKKHALNGDGFDFVKVIDLRKT